MIFFKRGAIVLLKTLVVLFIPYYWISTTSTTSGIHVSTTYLIAGTWGQWASQGSAYYVPYEPIPFWEQNQILFSFLFILPLLIFTLLFGHQQPNRKWIAAAGVSVFISFISVYILTPNYDMSAMIFMPDRSLPKVISLSIFVFIFWPLLRNLWYPHLPISSTQGVQNIRSKLKRIRREILPINTASLVWMALIVFPSVLTVRGLQISETQVYYDLVLSGGLGDFYYSYIWFRSPGQIYPVLHASTTLSTATWISPVGALLWILNLWLGLTTLQFVLGKSTLKRVRIIAIASVLIYAIPSSILIAASLLSGMPYFTIPLPFYPLVMLLVAKFVKPPSQEGPITEEMIRIPLGVRISSIFKRGKRKQETSEDGEIENQVEDKSDF